MTLFESVRVLLSDHAAQTGPGRGEVVLKGCDLQVQFGVRCAGFRQLACEAVEPVDHRGGAEVVQLAAEGLSEVGSQVLAFLAECADFMPGQCEIGSKEIDSCGLAVGGLLGLLLLVDGLFDFFLGSLVNRRARWRLSPCARP